MVSIADRGLVQKLQTRDFASIEAALQHFINSAGDQAGVIASSCLACAGPVVDNTCAMTNLKWVVDGAAISEQFGMRTAVSSSALQSRTSAYAGSHFGSLGVVQATAH